MYYQSSANGGKKNNQRCLTVLSRAYISPRQKQPKGHINLIL